jgi:hypothetical protein
MAKSKKAAVRGGKYATEIERIRALENITRIINRSDVESAAVSNVGRETESSNESVLDSLLDKLAEEDKGRISETRLKEIENLTTGMKEVHITKKVQKAKPNAKHNAKKLHAKSSKKRKK